MRVSFNYKHVDAHKPVAAEVDRRVKKLGKLLKFYAPDLIQLHGVFGKNRRTNEESCALTLSLPSGALHVTGTGKNVLAGCKNAFKEIEAQVKKHQALLRKEHSWGRGKRPVTSELG